MRSRAGTGGGGCAQQYAGADWPEQVELSATPSLSTTQIASPPLAALSIIGDPSRNPKSPSNFFLCRMIAPQPSTVHPTMRPADCSHGMILCTCTVRAAARPACLPDSHHPCDARAWLLLDARRCCFPADVCSPPFRRSSPTHRHGSRSRIDPAVPGSLRAPSPGPGESVGSTSHSVRRTVVSLIGSSSRMMSATRACSACPGLCRVRD